MKIMAVRRVFSGFAIIFLFYIIFGEKLLTSTWKYIKIHSSNKKVNNARFVDNRLIQLEMFKQEFVERTSGLLNIPITPTLWHVFSLDN